MRRNRPQGSNRRVRSAPTRKIDLPALVVSALTVCFATLFIALLLTRPEAGEPGAPMGGGAGSVQAPPPATVPQVAAPPPELGARSERKSDSVLSPALRAELEQLGIECAEGANCYPD
jgi:hypothetical protein